MLGTLHFVFRTQGGGGHLHLQGGQGFTLLASLIDLPRHAGGSGGGQGLHLTQRLHSYVTGSEVPQDRQPGIVN
jgi:hypothetical protein